MWWSARSSGKVVQHATNWYSDGAGRDLIRCGPFHLLQEVGQPPPTRSPYTSVAYTKQSRQQEWEKEIISWYFAVLHITLSILLYLPSNAYECKLTTTTIDTYSGVHTEYIQYIYQRMASRLWAGVKRRSTKNATDRLHACCTAL